MVQVHLGYSVEGEHWALKEQMRTSSDRGPFMENYPIAKAV